MKASARPDVRLAMARLAAARPPVADQTEGIVPRAERARLLRSIVETVPPPPASSPTARRPSVPVPAGRWADPPPPPPPSRRPALAGALVASLVAAGLVVAGLVGGGGEPAQVRAGTGEAVLPALAPPLRPPSFVPTDLPEGLVIQEASVVSATLEPSGLPYVEVYGRVGPAGAIEEAVAVITAQMPDLVDLFLEDSGAAVSPVPGEAGMLDIDFGHGLVARSWTTGQDDPTELCGTEGCVEIVNRKLSVVVLGRDLDGGAAALPGVIDGLVVRPDEVGPGARIEAPGLLADGFVPVYRGVQLPGGSSGPGRVVRYGDERGREVTLRVEEGSVFVPSAVAWQFPESRAVDVGGHRGLLVANDLLTAVTWQERPKLTLSIELRGFTEEDALHIANSVEEVTSPSD